MFDFNFPLLLLLFYLYYTILDINRNQMILKEYIIQNKYICNNTLFSSNI